MTHSLFFSLPFDDHQGSNRVFNWELCSALLLNGAAWVVMLGFLYKLGQ